MTKVSYVDKLRDQSYILLLKKLLIARVPIERLRALALLRQFRRPIEAGHVRYR
jgi:hypothetical protein